MAEGLLNIVALPYLKLNPHNCLIDFREKGGAYGSGAKQGDSVFSFFSYRQALTIFVDNILQLTIAFLHVTLQLVIMTVYVFRQ